MSYNDTLKKLESAQYDYFMKKIYFTDEKVKENKERYREILSSYKTRYGDADDIRFFCARCRSEV